MAREKPGGGWIPPPPPPAVIGLTYSLNSQIISRKMSLWFTIYMSFLSAESNFLLGLSDLSELSDHTEKNAVYHFLISLLIPELQSFKITKSEGQ